MVIGIRRSDSGLSESTPILRSFESRGSSSSSPLSCCQRFTNYVSNGLKAVYRGMAARFSFAILSFLGLFNVYSMRVNINVAIVAMAGKQVLSHDDHVACKELLTPFNSSFPNAIHAPTRTEFDWDSETQSMVLGSFFIGYVITQIPGGILAEKYGAKWLFGLGVLVTSIFTLLTPVAARLGVNYLIAVRVIEGLAEGVTFPAMHGLIGRWVPELERSRIATLIYTGTQLGTVISLLGSAYISASDTLGGWPTVFYFFGALGVFWFVFWILLVYDTPEEHPRISKEELEYIRSGKDPKRTKAKRGAIPWRAVLTSCPMYALIITHFGYNWGFYMLLTNLPTYLSNILHFDLKQNGLLSAAPYVCQAMFAFMASIIADKMRASGRFTITFIRKLMNSTAFFPPCALVGLVAFVGCESDIILLLIVSSVAFSGFMYSGFNVTHVDMSPDLASTLMGITNCVANISGFLAPQFVGFIIKDGQTAEKWGIVFLTTAAIYFLTGMIYNIFGSAELQPWGVAEERPTTSEETERKTAPVPNDDYMNRRL